MDAYFSSEDAAFAASPGPVYQPALPPPAAAPEPRRRRRWVTVSLGGLFRWPFKPIPIPGFW